jgi:hypothetical protein
MKTLLTAVLCLGIVLPCYAPPVPPKTDFSAVGVVLAITVLAVAGTAVYVVVKCAQKLSPPPTIEKSTNRVDWSTSGQMVVTADGMEYREPATNQAAFFRLVR